ncbi:cell division protein FtsA [Candidatus Saccharibacteria bacterium]|nr:cell division protein FtsA [Candidatus Saccharibacteria bacterium]
MDEVSRYVVGLDVGTENVRAVVATVNKDKKLTVVGYNETKNSGMRKGIVANLAGPAEAIDKALGEVERMSGYEINSATISINGAQILTTKVEGMIAVGMPDHEITYDDLDRVKQVAITGRIPANMDILDVVPLGYALDEQGGIKDPVGMVGSRLEMKASIITALSPNCNNLKKVAEMAKVSTEMMVPSVVASAKAVLSEKQMENGVAVVDFGAATTSVAIFEEGDLQYVGVVPAGSNNITNDLAIFLKVNTEIAEEIKKRYVNAEFSESKNIVLKIGRDEMHFDRKEVDEAVEARLNEIFEKVRKELKKAGFDRRLPEGIVLTGGGAKLRGIESFVKEALEASVKIGQIGEYAGIADTIKKPEYATAIGLMMIASESEGAKNTLKNKKKKVKKDKKEGFLKKFFKKF